MTVGDGVGESDNIVIRTFVDGGSGGGKSSMSRKLSSGFVSDGNSTWSISKNSSSSSSSSTLCVLSINSGKACVRSGSGRYTLFFSSIPPSSSLELARQSARLPSSLFKRGHAASAGSIPRMVSREDASSSDSRIACCISRTIVGDSSSAS